MIKNENIFKKNILYVVRLKPTISTLTAIRSIQMAKRDSDGYRIRKYFSLKSLLFIMFVNLKLVLRSYTSLYGIFMSACLNLFIYKSRCDWLCINNLHIRVVCISHDRFGGIGIK